jgi:Uma2 family endonuclease
MAPAVADPPRVLTAEEFAAMPELGRYTELVKGEVIHVPPPSFLHGVVCANVAGELRDFVRPRKLGRITTNDSGVVTDRDPDTVRGADVAYFSYERLPKDVTPRVYPDVPPELVFEVMSPDDVFRDVMAKVDEYLAAGVLLVYVIDPSRDQAMLFQKDTLGTLFGPSDVMTFPGVLPDLRIPVGPLFQEG